MESSNEEESEWESASDDDIEVKDNKHLPAGNEAISIKSPSLNVAPPLDTSPRANEKMDFDKQSSHGKHQKSPRTKHQPVEEDKKKAVERSPRTRDPASVPKVGNFFMHDNRDGGGNKSVTPGQQRGKGPDSSYKKPYRNEKRDSDDDFHWKHDKFEQLISEEDAAPKRRPNDRNNKGPYRKDEGKRPNEPESLSKTVAMPVTSEQNQAPTSVFARLGDASKETLGNKGSASKKSQNNTASTPQAVPTSIASKSTVGGSGKKGQSAKVNPATDSSKSQDLRKEGKRDAKQNPKSATKVSTPSATEAKHKSGPPPGLPLNPAAREFQPVLVGTSSHTTESPAYHVTAPTDWPTAASTAATTAYSYDTAASYTYSTAPMTTIAPVDEYGNPIYAAPMPYPTYQQQAMVYMPDGHAIPMHIPIGVPPPDSGVWYPPQQQYGSSTDMAVQAPLAGNSRGQGRQRYSKPLSIRAPAVAGTGTASPPAPVAASSTPAEPDSNAI